MAAGAEQAEQAEATRGAGPALHCDSHSAGCGSGQAAAAVSLLQPAPSPSVSSVVARRRRPEGSQPAKEPLPGRSCRCCCDRGTVSFSRSSTALICKAAAPRPPEGPVPTANVRSTPAAATAWRAGRGEEAATPPRPHPGGLASPAAPAFATRARSRPSTLRRDPVPAAEGPPLRRPRPETQDGRDRVTDRLRIPEPSRRERAVARTWRGSKRARAGLWCRLLILIA